MSTESATELEEYISSLTTTENIKSYFYQYGKVYRWIIVLLFNLLAFSSLLAGTLINVAIPQIMGAFGVGQDDAQWLATGNLASAALSMLLSAWLIQAIGMRYTLMIGMSLFLAGSVIGGLCNDIDIMIISRIMQGVSAGMILPITMSTVFKVFPKGEHGYAVSIALLGSMVAPAIGPTIGGILVDSFNWRYVFFIGVPFSLISLPLILIFLPNREQNSQLTAFDWLGFALITISLSSALIGFSNGESEGWSSDYIYTCFITALFALCTFVIWEQHTKQPLMELSVFLDMNFLFALGLGMVVSACLYGSSYLVPLFLLTIQSQSPTETGLLLMPAGFVMLAISPLAGRITDNVNPRIVAIVGLFFLALSFYLMTDSHVNTGFWIYAYWYILGRIGIGVINPVIMVQAYKSLPEEMLNHGASAFSFVRMLGGVFGVNLLSMALTNRSNFHTDSLTTTQSFDNHSTTVWISSLSEQLTISGKTSTEIYASAVNYLSQALETEALALAFRDTFLILGLVCLIFLIPAWMLGRTDKRTMATTNGTSGD